jgi:hypothetical protein
MILITLTLNKLALNLDSANNIKKRSVIIHPDGKS